MPVLTITKTYADGDTLFEADLDNLKDDIENFLNTTKINDDNIQSSGITGSTKLVDASVSSAKLASAAVTTSKIDDAAVTTAKLNDASVTTAKIVDASITQAKRASLGQQLSSSCSTFSTTTLNTFEDVANLTVTITTTGRPIFIGMIPDGSNKALLKCTFGNSGDTSKISDIQLLRGATSVFLTSITSTPSSGVPIIYPVSSIYTVDTPSAGTYTYKVQVRSFYSAPVTTSFDVNYAKLIAYEL